MANYEQLSGHGAPSNKTVGNVGQTYVDLDTKKEYICAQIFTVTGYKIKRESYTWVDRELDPDEYATAKSITVTLASSGWDSMALTQTVTVSDVLADETKQLIIFTPAIASQSAYYEAGILCTGQAANSLTFTAKTAPTEDLTVYVTIQKVTQE